MDNTRRGTVAVAAALLCVWALLAVPRLTGTPESRREADLAAGVKVVKYALLRYSQSHAGEYPRTADVTGGENAKDVLIKGGYLVRYPPNPFDSRGAAMRNAAGGGFSAGHFVYERKSDSKYEYILYGWGAGEGRRVGMTGSGNR